MTAVIAALALFLPMHSAREAIYRSETKLYRGEHVQVTMGPCKRLSRAHVTCSVFLYGAFFTINNVPVKMTVREEVRASLRRGHILLSWRLG
jgi:hypothetical protein